MLRARRIDGPWLRDAMQLLSDLCQKTPRSVRQGRQVGMICGSRGLRVARGAPVLPHLIGIAFQPPIGGDSDCLRERALPQTLALRPRAMRETRPQQLCSAGCTALSSVEKSHKAGMQHALQHLRLPAHPGPPRQPFFVHMAVPFGAQLHTRRPSTLKEQATSTTLCQQAPSWPRPSGRNLVPAPCTCSSVHGPAQQSAKWVAHDLRSRNKQREQGACCTTRRAIAGVIGRLGTEQRSAP